MRVPVLDTSKKPLAPTTPRRARLLLKKGKAAVFRRYPFTIILKREVVNPATPDLKLKIDPGSKTTGVAIVNQQTGEVVFAAEIEHRGHEIKKRLDERRAYRRNRRARKTRYRPKRFNNRVRRKGWLPPSLTSRIENVESCVRRLLRVYPIKGLAQERVKFDMQIMQNPDIEGIEYQQGELQGFEIREYVFIKFKHACVYARAKSPCSDILNIDHVVPRARGGSNRVSNLVCACRKHNEEKDNTSLEAYCAKHGVDASRIEQQAKAPLKDAAAVNATRWALFERLKAFGLPIETGSGGLTKFNRIQRELPKTHWIDAACVGTSTPERLNVEACQSVLVMQASGHGSRKMRRNDAFGFPARCKDDSFVAPRERQKERFGFQTGDIVKADIPRGKFAGKHVGRLGAVRARKSFNLNGFDVNSDYLVKIHRSDGFCYSLQAVAMLTQGNQKALGHSTLLPWPEGRPLPLCGCGLRGDCHSMSSSSHFIRQENVGEENMTSPRCQDMITNRAAQR